MKKIQSTFLPALVAGFATILTSGFATADIAYVANNGNNSVEEIVNGTPSAFISPTVDLNGPTGLAIFDGNLYVANNATPNNGFIAEFALSNGAFEGDVATGLASPRGLTFDSAGNLYVANQANGTIAEIPTGGGPASTIVSGLGNPNAVAFDNSGNLYVTSGIVYSVSGGVATPFATSGLTSPNGLAFDSAGNLFVVNHNNSTVLEFDSTGAPVAPIPFIADLNSSDQPKTIAIDSAGDFYVTDYGDNTVTEYDSSGNIMTVFNQPGAFSGPCAVITAITVPEPATYAILLAGLGILYFFHRRKLAMI